MRLITKALIPATLAMLLAGPVLANVPETVTENGFISGTMDIDFQTRKNLDDTGKLAEGSPAEGAKDIYNVNLNVAKTTEFSGKILREPTLFSKILGREVQTASLKFELDLAVRNPKDLSQRKVVGKWVGPVKVDTSGKYDFGSETAGASALRMAIDAVGKAQAFVGNFGGTVQGKATKQTGLLQKAVASAKTSVRSYSRLVGGKKVTITAKEVDPLRFNNLVLGEGPAQIYPRTVVNGDLDYDYETGNWYANNIKFKYTFNGVEYEDIVTGSIKWVEDPNRAANGKGSYDFNLRFNEAKLKPVTDESAAFAGDASQAEDAFFEVDNSVPSMTGTMSYQDTIGGEDTVYSSKVTYSLNANQLTKQQAMNMFKLLMVAVGPMNDE